MLLLLAETLAFYSYRHAYLPGNYSKYIPVGGSALLTALVRSASYQRQSCFRIAPIPMCMQGADNYSWEPKNVLLLFVSAVGESGRNMMRFLP